MLPGWEMDGCEETQDCFTHILSAFLDISDISEIYFILTYCSIFLVYFINQNGHCGLSYWEIYTYKCIYNI